MTYYVTSGQKKLKLGLPLEVRENSTKTTITSILVLHWHSHNNNNNNNNIVISKAHKVSSNAESEAPAVARWAGLVGYAKITVLRRRLKVSALGESLLSRGKSL